ncbi:hypothetical protein [Flavobacterium sp. 3HN19-14]|uniref:hypothetical protein n=1 Tax=Flavobacterium sp. 3HN19-14 TaxID=3448133 RepID=UPI003EE11330
MGFSFWVQDLRPNRFLKPVRSVVINLRFGFWKAGGFLRSLTFVDFVLNVLRESHWKNKTSKIAPIGASSFCGWRSAAKLLRITSSVRPEKGLGCGMTVVGLWDVVAPETSNDYQIRKSK